MTARKPLPVDLIDKKGLGGIYPANPLKFIGTEARLEQSNNMPYSFIFHRHKTISGMQNIQKTQLFDINNESGNF